MEGGLFGEGREATLKNLGGRGKTKWTSKISMSANMKKQEALSTMSLLQMEGGARS